jgi:RimJ/RimL family protein N-acetyltransferase
VTTGVTRAPSLGSSLEHYGLMLAHAFTFVDTVVFWVADTNWRSQRAMEMIGGVRRPELQPRFLAGQMYAHVVFEITKRDFYSSAIWS